MSPHPPIENKQKIQIWLFSPCSVIAYGYPKESWPQRRTVAIFFNLEPPRVCAVHMTHWGYVRVSIVVIRLESQNASSPHSLSTILPRSRLVLIAEASWYYIFPNNTIGHLGTLPPEQSR
jgi:hypothetical protein